MDNSRVNLIEPKDKAASMISGHIGEGKKLLERTINTPEELRDAKNLYKKWRDYAQEMLRQLFNNDSVANSMRRGGRVLTMGAPFRERVKDYEDDFRTDITNLESIEERLPLIPESEGLNVKNEAKVVNSKPSGKKVFVVHGHDNAAKIEIARFLEQLGLEPIILHEQANEGKTIIEKFELHSESTGYAIIILSPDDLGSNADNPDEARPRARQNVIFEWGYFVGKLGRNKVNALYFKGVELPSDNDGVLYTPFDESRTWQMLVAKELKQAGYKIDLNKLI